MSMTVVGHPLLRLLAVGDIKFFLGFLTFCVVILVLAYLTNPSEPSFRAYLTEQSFRLHLSRLDRLDDPQDDVNPGLTSSITANPSPACPFSLDNHALVHFATRASISLRTPKHVFHSFGIFTVATMLPMAKVPQRNDSHLSSVVNDSWYVGAFGKWWRGGGIEAWYQDVIARSKDEESTSSGILSLTNLDIRHDYPGLPTLSPTNRGVPPKLKNRERSSQRTNGPPARPETPPPLPKSASLPLHASGPKHLSCISWPNINTPTLSTLCLSNSSPDQANQGASLETLPDFAPRVAELLRQITQRQRTVLDLRAQLSDCKTATSQSRLHLQGQLDTQRGYRRQEDAVKIELKSRTKSLDDSKRQAEGLKREAEKKLRTAQIATTNATDFLSALGKKIIQLQKQMADDQSFIAHQPTQSVSLSSLTKELDRKKQEIKAMEVHVSSLSQRARELEGKLSEARERLKYLKHKTGIRKSDMQQMMDDRLVRSLSSISDEQDPNTILLERHLRLEMPEHHMNMPEASLAAASDTPIDSGCSPASLHHYETKLPIDPSGRISLSDRPATFSPDAISSRQSTVTSSAITSPESVFLLGREGGITNSYPTNFDAHQDQRETNPKLNGDHGTETKYHINTVPGSAWGHPPEYEYVGAEAFPGNACQHDWHQFGLHESGSKFDTIPESRRSATTGQLDASTLYPLGYHPSTPPVATTSNPSLLRAFAPSPAERQVFQRTLGSMSNASLERLPSLGDVGRVPISPPLLTGASKDLPSRALPSWLLQPQNHHVNFSPWDDEEQERSS